METTENTATNETETTRQQRTSYFLVTMIGEFKNKAEVETYLNTHGGAPAGAQIVRGARVEAKTKQVFKIN